MGVTIQGKCFMAKTIAVVLRAMTLAPYNRQPVLELP
jgi:hypothetical protein